MASSEGRITSLPNLSSLPSDGKIFVDSTEGGSGVINANEIYKVTQKEKSSATLSNGHLVFSPSQTSSDRTDVLYKTKYISVNPSGSIFFTDDESDNDGHGTNIGSNGIQVTGPEVEDWQLVPNAELYLYVPENSNVPVLYICDENGVEATYKNDDIIMSSKWDGTHTSLKDTITDILSRLSALES